MARGRRGSAIKPPAWASRRTPDLGDWPRADAAASCEYSARQMPHVPLWNPYIVGGRPYHGNAQSALFGPYTWPVYVLPFWTALGVIAVLKLWVAAFGTFLLGRSLGMRFGGALFAGIVFALSLKLVTWVIYPSMGVWTWYPLLLLRLRAPGPPTGRRSTAAGLAVVVALQFLTGHPESNFHALVLTTCFFALRRRTGSPRTRRRPRGSHARLLRSRERRVGRRPGPQSSCMPFVELLLAVGRLRGPAGRLGRQRTSPLERGDRDLPPGLLGSADPDADRADHARARALRRSPAADARRRRPHPASPPDAALAWRYSARSGSAWCSGSRRSCRSSPGSRCSAQGTTPA